MKMLTHCFSMHPLDSVDTKLFIPEVELVPNMLMSCPILKTGTTSLFIIAVK